MRTALVVALLVVAGTASAQSRVASPREAAAPAASLLITAWPDGRGGTARSWTLRCGPAGGTLPRAARACSRLATLDRPFAPVPPGTACTQIFGGPQEAVVRGPYRGRKVWARFTRSDGCQIARWNRHAFLFPIRVGAG